MSLADAAKDDAEVFVKYSNGSIRSAGTVQDLLEEARGFTGTHRPGLFDDFGRNINLPVHVLRAVLRSIGGSIVLDLPDLLAAISDTRNIVAYETKDPSGWVLKIQEKE